MARNRLNLSGATQLLNDNPAKAVKFDLCNGTRVHVPGNFAPNGLPVQSVCQIPLYRARHNLQSGRLARPPTDPD